MRSALTAFIVLFLPAAVSRPTMAQTADEPQREEIVVVGRTPLPGSTIAVGKVPGSVQLLSADDFAANHTRSVLDTLGQRIPGLQLSDPQGNGAFQDVHYRGFSASPLQGTPQGIAVYQNGVRLNEAFGDTVNWELIPEVAISRLALTSNNPAFGLNALGGALNMVMKNGFTDPGFEAEIEGGSYDHVSGSVEYGVQSDRLAFYVAGEAFTDGSYRLFSHSDLQRLYADVGYRDDGSEFHLVGQAARSNLGVVGATPIDLTKRQGIAAVYTWPQSTANETMSLAATGSSQLTDHVSIQTNLYGRHLQQKHVDGNDGNFVDCGPDSSYPGRLCLASDGFGGAPSPAFLDQFVIVDGGRQNFPYVDGAPYGTLDRTSTNTTTVGGALQLTVDAPLLGHGNDLVLGASLDHSDIRFASNSMLAAIDPKLQVGLDQSLPGSGAIIRTLGSVGYQPVALDATTDYWGAYLSDTVDLTQALSATVGLRVNVIDIRTRDATGGAPELNADNSFAHASPQAGLTWAFADGVTAYGGYSQSNRAPTPLELNCADRLKPCLLENALVSDPPLKQVVADNYEAGLRGASNGAELGRIGWSLGLYRTESTDDIVALASAIQGRGSYVNVPETLRQGVELAATWRRGRLSLFANYSYVDATFQFTGTVASPNNPKADAAGNIQVHPGDRIPGIPNHQLKLGADYEILSGWTVGGDVAWFGSQTLVGDEANLNARLTPYMLVNVRTAYQVSESVQIFAKINNLFDRRYASYGTYFDTGGVGQPITDGFADARTITIGQPVSVFGGVKIRF